MRRALTRSSHKQSPFREPQPAGGPIAHLHQPADRQKPAMMPYCTSPRSGSFRLACRHERQNEECWNFPHRDFISDIEPKVEIGRYLGCQTVEVLLARKRANGPRNFRSIANSRWTLPAGIQSVASVAFVVQRCEFGGVVELRLSP
jgi:hypothetical protein